LTNENSDLFRDIIISILAHKNNSQHFERKALLVFSLAAVIFPISKSDCEFVVEHTKTHHADQVENSGGDGGDNASWTGSNKNIQ